MIWGPLLRKIMIVQSLTFPKKSDMQRRIRIKFSINFINIGLIHVTMAIKAKPASKNFLNDAISDVKKELKKLSVTRKTLTSKLTSSTKLLLSTKATEDRLRDRLSLLIAREGKIREAQSTIRGALTKLKSRTTRVKKIKDDLSESD